MHEDTPTLFDAVEPGAVYWITGLPGAGRRTLAAAVRRALRRSGRAVVGLDGHTIRNAFDQRFGYGLAERRTLAISYGQLCRALSLQGLDVVFATASLFRQAHAWNRSHLPRYREIYLSAAPERIIARHPKGLLAAARAGRIRNVPGADLPFDAPSAPDVVVVDDGRTPELLAREALDGLGLTAPV